MATSDSRKKTAGRSHAGRTEAYSAAPLANIQTLVSAIQELSLARSLNEIMAIVRRAAREITGSDGATFILRDGNYCFYADEDAISPLWKGKRFPIENCISGWSMLHRQPVVLEDIYRDPRIPARAYEPTFVKSLTVVPIRSADPIGAIGTYWATPHVSSTAEVGLLQTLANSTAVAMQNIQLYDDLTVKVGELQRLSVSKDQFLMTLSHELRTPLNAIIGWADQLLADGDPVAKNEGLETIARSARHQAKIVDDLLDSSRILAGKIEFDRRVVDIRDVVRGALTAIRPVCEKRDIEIVYRFPDEPIWVRVDQARIQQALGHLLSNAVKFSPRERSVEVSVLLEDGWVSIQVRDHGIGLSEDFLARTFERFNQADGTTTRAYGGLGLGLSIAKYLVEAQGGTIGAGSDGLGKGAAFTITLPRETGGPRIGSEPGVRTSGGTLSGMKFLAIDDDEDSRVLLAHFLRRQGGEVATAGGAAEGFEKLSKFRPDLVICDLSMPGEDGYSFVQKLRGSDSSDVRTLPAVAFSAFTDLTHENEAIRAGFDSFIPKPLDGKQFIERILETWRIRGKKF